MKILDNIMTYVGMTMLTVGMWAQRMVNKLRERKS